MATFIFDSGDLPSAEVINRLMGLVLNSEGAILDWRTPRKGQVLKSIVLQYLLKSRCTNVGDYINDFLKKKRLNASSKSEKQQEKLFHGEVAMVITCLQECRRLNPIYHRTTRGHIRDIFETAKLALGSKELTFGTLSSIGEVRFALHYMAINIAREFGATLEADQARNEDMPKLIEILEDLSQKFEMPRMYLIQLIAKQYGINCLLDAGAKYPFLVKVGKDNSATITSGQIDRLRILGEQYDVHTEIVQVLLDGGTIPVQEFDERMLMLAVCGHPGFNGLSTEKVQVTCIWDKLKDILKNETLKDICAASLIGRGDPKSLHHFLRTDNHKSSRDWELKLLLLHFHAVFQNDKPNPLLEPIRQLTNNPACIKESYLPGFPDRAETFDIMENLPHVFGAEIKNKGYKACVNGHPYVVGECGKARQSGKCGTCGVKIGKGTNDSEYINEIREMGHFIDEASHHHEYPLTQRLLETDAFTIVRLLTHLALAWVDDADKEELLSSIHPPIRRPNIFEFLKRHIENDLQCIARFMNFRMDDSFVLVHLLLKYIGSQSELDDCVHDVLTKKSCRKKWEKQFYEYFLKPVLDVKEDLIRKGSSELVRDTVLAHSKQDTKAPMSVGEGHPYLWRLEATITVAGLKKAHYLRRLRNVNKEPVLHMFLTQIDKLSMVKYIWSILTLQEAVISMYARRLTVQDAKQMTISSFLDDLPTADRPKIEQCYKEFTFIWKRLRRELGSGMHSGIMGQRLEEIEVLETSKLIMLLPTGRGEGICSLALLQYLTQIQNTFLEEYWSAREIRRLSAVTTGNVNRDQLICFGVEDDIMPMLYCNCNYQMDFNADMELEYQFSSLEEQIEARFLKAKPRIDPMFEEFSFKDTNIIGNSNIPRISRIIPQVELDVVSQKSVMDIKNISHFNDLLSALDTAAGFLTIIGGDAEMKIVSYLKDTLSMPSQQLFFDYKLDQCMLKHMKSLWLLMSHSRARHMVLELNLDPFEDMGGRYLKRPDETSVSSAFAQVNLDSCLDALFEIIVLTIPDMAFEDYDEHEETMLRDYLLEFAEEKQLHGISEWAEDILVMHCVEVWRIGTKKLHVRNKKLT